MNMNAKLMKAVAVSMSLLGSAAFVAAFAMPDAAYANGGKGGGKGNDGGNGNSGGNGGGNGNGNGGGKGNGNGGQGGSNKSESGKSGKASTKKTSETAPVIKKVKRQEVAEDLGVSAAELGALNAAHASPNALMNASPNSRVGRIAAYRDAVLDGEQLQEDLDTKQAILDGLEEPTRTSAEIQTALEQPGLTEQQISDLNDELTAALEYEALSAEVADLEEQIEDQPMLERDLLEAAANKPVDDDIEAAVKALLGL